MSSIDNGSNSFDSESPSFEGTSPEEGFGLSSAKTLTKISLRGKIIAGVVAATVAIGGGSAYALFNNSNVNLFVALNSWFKSDVIDTTISLQYKPEAMRSTGYTDQQIQDLELSGITTVEQFATALGQTSIHLQTNKSASKLEEMNYAIALQYGTANVADLRFVERVLYLRSDLAKLPEVTPQAVSQKQIDDLRETAKETGAYLGNDSVGVRLINTIISGETASVSLKSDTVLGKLLDQALVTATAKPNPPVPGETQLQKLIVDSLKKASTITGEGRDSTGNKFLLTLDLGKFGEYLNQGIKTINLGIFEFNRKDIEDAIAELAPEAKGYSLQMRAWATRGSLKRLEFDLSPVINLSQPNATLKNWDIAMRMDIGNDSPSAPRNSVDFTPDINALYEGLLTLGG